MISPPSSTRTPASARHCAVEFQALPPRIGQVRRIVSAQLRYWRLDAVLDVAALLLTELLANVHRHADPGGGGAGPAPADKHCTVELSLVGDRLTVSVHDHDPRLPRVRSAASEESPATSGRGLALVASLSESWGVRARPDGSGKTVWFSLPVPAPEPAARVRGRAGRAARDAAAPEPPSRPAPVPPPAEVEAAAAG
ncbi:ATP-binding protein [Streptomyces qinglanensis]|uniref:ATP-binding protein n=1 Tax=Streptomyces qinglanensis TaxID=943816 RepID=UPI003D72B7AE